MSRKIPGVTRVETGWRVRVKRKGPDGQTADRVITLPPDTTYQARLQARATLIAEIEAGWRRPDLHTVEDYVGHWLNRKAQHCRPSTVDGYRRALDKLLLPHLGACPLRQVARWHIVQMASNITRTTRLTPINLRLAWATCLALLRDLAAETGQPDPTLRVQPPRTTRQHTTHRKALTGPQLRDLLDRASQGEALAFPAIALMAYTGCRRGEALGLMWDCVDWSERLIHIRRRWTTTGMASGTKTGGGRTVPMPRPLEEILRAHRASQRAGAVLVCEGLKADRPISTKALATAMARCAGYLGLGRVTPHDLRRTYNTLLVRAGTDRLVIRAILGHTAESMTALYHQPTAEDLRGVLEDLEV